MQILFILNESPYGSEKSYNGLRTALQLLKEDGSIQIKIFLIGESVGCALINQNPIASNFVIEKMLSEILEKGGKVKICKSCLDARGFTNSSLVKGSEISNMSEYAQWILKSDKIITL
jgi:uncharacterized protein involved in oxidation of intracellular sulfur